MVIITWKQNEGGSHRRGEAYTMRAVVKPTVAGVDTPFTVEREHVDAAGGKGWIPANHTHAMAIVCKALLQLADNPGSVGRCNQPPMTTIDLGVLDLPGE